MVQLWIISVEFVSGAVASSSLQKLILCYFHLSQLILDLYMFQYMNMIHWLAVMVVLRLQSLKKCLVCATSSSSDLEVAYKYLLVSKAHVLFMAGIDLDWAYYYFSIIFSVIAKKQQTVKLSYRHLLNSLSGVYFFSTLVLYLKSSWFLFHIGTSL